MRTHRLARLLTSAAVVLGVGVVAPVVTAPAASAGGYGCTGGLVDSYGINADHGVHAGKKIADVYTYWDGSQNCQVVVKRGPLAGISTRMSFTTYAMTTSRTIKDWDEDPGYFSSYAGPNWVNGAGLCVAEEVNMWDQNGTLAFQGGSYRLHNCG